MILAVRNGPEEPPATPPTPQPPFVKQHGSIKVADVDITTATPSTPHCSAIGDAFDQLPAGLIGFLPGAPCRDPAYMSHEADTHGKVATATVTSGSCGQSQGKRHLEPPSGDGVYAVRASAPPPSSPHPGRQSQLRLQPSHRTAVAAAAAAGAAAVALHDTVPAEATGKDPSTRVYNTSALYGEVLFGSGLVASDMCGDDATASVLPPPPSLQLPHHFRKQFQQQGSLERPQLQSHMQMEADGFMGYEEPAMAEAAVAARHPPDCTGSWPPLPSPPPLLTAPASPSMAASVPYVGSSGQWQHPHTMIHQQQGRQQPRIVDGFPQAGELPSPHIHPSYTLMTSPQHHQHEQHTYQDKQWWDQQQQQQQQQKHKQSLLAATATCGRFEPVSQPPPPLTSTAAMLAASAQLLAESMALCRGGGNGTKGNAEEVTDACRPPVEEPNPGGPPLPSSHILRMSPCRPPAPQRRHHDHRRYHRSHRRLHSHRAPYDGALAASQETRIRKKYVGTTGVAATLRGASGTSDTCTSIGAVSGDVEIPFTDHLGISVAKPEVAYRHPVQSTLELLGTSGGGGVANNATAMTKPAAPSIAADGRSPQSMSSAVQHGADPWIPISDWGDGAGGSRGGQGLLHLGSGSGLGSGSNPRSYRAGDVLRCVESLAMCRGSKAVPVQVSVPAPVVVAGCVSPKGISPNEADRNFSVAREAREGEGEGEGEGERGKVRERGSQTGEIDVAAGALMLLRDFSTPPWLATGPDPAEGDRPPAEGGGPAGTTSELLRMTMSAPAAIPTPDQASRAPSAHLAWLTVAALPSHLPPPLGRPPPPLAAAAAAAGHFSRTTLPSARQLQQLQQTAAEALRI